AARLLTYARYIRSEDRAHHAVTSGQDRPARAAVVLHLDDTPRATQGSELRGEPRGGRCRWRADGLRRPPCWPVWWHVEQRFVGLCFSMCMTLSALRKDLNYAATPGAAAAGGAPMGYAAPHAGLAGGTSSSGFRGTRHRTNPPRSLIITSGPLTGTTLNFQGYDVIAGRAKKVHPLLYVVAALFVVYFAVDPILGAIN